MLYVSVCLVSLQSPLVMCIDPRRLCYASLSVTNGTYYTISVTMSQTKIGTRITPKGHIKLHSVEDILTDEFANNAAHTPFLDSKHTIYSTRLKSKCSDIKLETR